MKKFNVVGVNLTNLDHDKASIEFTQKRLSNHNGMEINYIKKNALN
jgi:hypothetical protein